MYNNKIEFEVVGEYGLFSDPLTRMGGEKLSYPVPTYEAIKGIVHSIYWKPTLIWYIDSVRVMNPITMEPLSTKKIKYNSSSSDLSYYTYLKNCRYQVRAHFEWNENRPELAGDRNAPKHLQIAQRAIARGGRRDVFLGTRECQADVSPCTFGEGDGWYDNAGTVVFGNMFHGITYADEAYPNRVPETEGCMSKRFWIAEMKNGIIEYPKPWDCIHERVMSMPVKEFCLDKNMKKCEEDS